MGLPSLVFLFWASLFWRLTMDPGTVLSQPFSVVLQLDSTLAKRQVTPMKDLSLRNPSPAIAPLPARLLLLFREPMWQYVSLTLAARVASTTAVVRGRHIILPRLPAMDVIARTSSAFALPAVVVALLCAIAEAAVLGRVRPVAGIDLGVPGGIVGIGARVLRCCRL